MADKFLFTGERELAASTMLLAVYMEEAANVSNETVMAICTEAESLTKVNDGGPHATPPPSPKDALDLAGFCRCSLGVLQQEGAEPMDNLLGKKPKLK